MLTTTSYSREALIKLLWHCSPLLNALLLLLLFPHNQKVRGSRVMHPFHLQTWIKVHPPTILGGFTFVLWAVHLSRHYMNFHCEQHKRSGMDCSTSSSKQIGQSSAEPEIIWLMLLRHHKRTTSKPSLSGGPVINTVNTSTLDDAKTTVLRPPKEVVLNQII